jgi:hypothetical protein
VKFRVLLSITITVVQKVSIELDAMLVEVCAEQCDAIPHRIMRTGTGIKKLKSETGNKSKYMVHHRFALRGGDSIRVLEFEQKVRSGGGVLRHGRGLARLVGFGKPVWVCPFASASTIQTGVDEKKESAKKNVNRHEQRGSFKG